MRLLESVCMNAKKNKTENEGFIKKRTFQSDAKKDNLILLAMALLI